MRRVPIARAAHLILYTDLLRVMGAPVDRDLARSHLPSRLEDMPDAYISVPLGLDFLARCGKDAMPTELGFLAGNLMTLGTFDREVQAAILAQPTGFARIEALSRVVHRENSAVRVRMRREGAQVRLICDLHVPAEMGSTAYSEWLKLHAMISIVRSVAGAGWCPAEMTFVCAGKPVTELLEAFGNTRILVGQPHNSILLSSEVLARVCPQHPATRAASPPQEEAVFEAWDFIAAIRAAILPYLGDGHLDIALAAKIAGMSKRTFQRRLEKNGLTYQQIEQQVRFGAACKLLADPDNKIIDIAFATGYGNPQHFTRAFRRIAGVTPSSFRDIAAP